MKKLILKDKTFISSERFEECQWNFQERPGLWYIKCHKKPGFHSLFRKHIFVKATREYGGPPTPSLFRAKFKKFSIGTVRFNYFPVNECF